MTLCLISLQNESVIVNVDRIIKKGKISIYAKDKTLRMEQEIDYTNIESVNVENLQGHFLVKVDLGNKTIQKEIKIM